MSDDSDELPIASDNFVVASEVMASAIRILALLDLSEREIAGLFQAETGEGTGLNHSPPAVDDDEEDVTGARPWRLFTLAENESCSKEVDRFAKRVSALRTDQEPGPAEVQKLADLCLGVIPAFAAAQRWYREQWQSKALSSRSAGMNGGPRPATRCSTMSMRSSSSTICPSPMSSGSADTRRPL